MKNYERNGNFKAEKWQFRLDSTKQNPSFLYPYELRAARQQHILRVILVCTARLVYRLLHVRYIFFLFKYNSNRGGT